MKKIFKKLWNDSHFAQLVVLAFLSFGILVILKHEMWADEVHVWRLAKNSFSLSSLFAEIRYTGHPGLWFLMVYVLTKFTQQMIAMQFLHLCVAACGVYLFVRFSPFTRLQKVLFAFGYFAFYEYGIISRDYSIGIALIFCFCALYNRLAQGKNLLLISTIVFLFSQANVYSFIIAISFGAMVCFACIFDADLRRSLCRRKEEAIGSIALFLLGIVVSVFTLIPPSDSLVISFSIPQRFLSFWQYFERLTAGVYKAYVPLPYFSRAFWNSNTITDPWFQFFFVVLFLCFFTVLFIRKPVILFFYLFGTGAMLAFNGILKYPFSMRHYGYYFIVFVVSIWLSAYGQERKIKPRLIHNAHAFCARYKNRVITGIFVVHFIACAIACGFDWFYPFSQAKNTAKFIETTQPSDISIIGDEPFFAAAVGDYLNRDMYDASGRKLGTFILWNTKLGRYGGKEVFKKAKELMLQKKRDVLIVLNYDIDRRKINLKRYHAVKIKEFKGSIILGCQDFFLYVMKYS